MTSPLRRRLASVLFALATLAGGQAFGYVRAVKNGHALTWDGTTCIPVTVYPTGFDQMPADEVGAAATAAAAAWSAAQNACSYLELPLTVSPDPGPVAIPQAQGAIVFRTTHWCFFEADGTCSTDATDNQAYATNVLMLTTTSVDGRTGQIYEAATEVNAINAEWADLVLHPEVGTAMPATQDLQNGLTHELGHFIGLDHSCVTGDPSPWPVDDTGQLAPDCGSAPPVILMSTMFPSALPGDLSKRTLDPDDQNGVCGIYPIASSPARCVPPMGIPVAMSGGCQCAASAGRPARAPLALTAFAVLSALAARSRRRVTRASRARPPFC